MSNGSYYFTTHYSANEQALWKYEIFLAAFEANVIITNKHEVSLRGCSSGVSVQHDFCFTSCCDHLISLM